MGVHQLKRYFVSARLVKDSCLSRVNHSAKCKVWRASRDADVKNHDLGGVIARSCKGREIADAILHAWQGREVEVCQFHVKSEVQTLRTKSGVGFKSDSGSLDLSATYLQKSAMATTGEWRDCSKLTMRIAQSRLSLIVLISVLIQRLHKL